MTTLFNMETPTERPNDLFAEVAIPAYVQQTYTYRVPAAFHETARRGCRVAVPFGKTLQVGYVVALHDTIAEDLPPDHIKDIEEWLDETPVLTDEIIDLTQWVSDYYYAPWGEALKGALPGGLNAAPRLHLTVTDLGRDELTAVQATHRAGLTKWKFLAWIVSAGGSVAASDAPKDYPAPRVRALARELERAGFLLVRQTLDRRRVQPKRRTIVRGSRQRAVGGRQQDLDAPGSSPEVKLTAAQERVMKVLEEIGDAIPFPDLTARATVSPSVVRTMEQKGLVEIFTQEVRRDPLAYLKTLPPSQAPALTPAQTECFAKVAEAIAAGEYRPFLLHGVTGSGKTEIYLQAMRAAIERGRTALMLVPEIGLTPLFARRLTERFGDLVALLHSSLSDGERMDEWERIREGDARIVIGTRSAVFAPLQDIGLIVVDEEHDGSYKQAEMLPYYHGRDTAIVRAHRANCPVILGSATPAVESAHHAASGKYTRLDLKERIGGRPLAAVEVVDMRAVFKRHGKQQVFSDELLTALTETQSRGEQAVMLLNRRGFSSFLLCRSCGESVHCKNCDVTLTFHKADQRLVCHYCAYQAAIPRQCPNCNGPYIYYVGEGTEQLEELLRARFPTFRIARLDRDTVRRRGAFERTLEEFAAGGLDLLVGTQMIAKGHDFPNVTLVGVISVDAGLALPDFRAAERTFQLLAQVAGRAGRGDLAGRVILQTYHPEHYALRCAARQDYGDFFATEIRFRQAMFYPPFSVLANVVIRHKTETQAGTLADRFARTLRAAAGDDRTIRILGPAAAPLAKLRGEYRRQILIKSRNRRRLREILDLAFARLSDQETPPGRASERRHITVEIDPVDLM